MMIINESSNEFSTSYPNQIINTPGPGPPMNIDKAVCWNTSGTGNDVVVLLDGDSWTLRLYTFAGDLSSSKFLFYRTLF